MINTHMSFVIQPTQVSLQGGSPFWNVHFPTQFGVISKLLQGTLDPTFHITYGDNKQHIVYKYWRDADYLDTLLKYFKSTTRLYVYW